MVVSPPSDWDLPFCLSLPHLVQLVAYERPQLEAHSLEPGAKSEHILRSARGLLSQDSWKGPKPWASGPQGRLGPQRNRKQDWEPQPGLSPSGECLERSSGLQMSKQKMGLPSLFRHRPDPSGRPLGSWLLPPPPPHPLCSGHRGPLFLLELSPSSHLQTPAVPFSLPSQIPLICQLGVCHCHFPWMFPLHPRPDQDFLSHTLQCSPPASQGCDAQFTWVMAG